MTGEGMNTVLAADEEKNGSVEVSVIVPAYNAQETLGNTILDILAQTFREFELILVDDGSTDGTTRLCEEAAEQDPRVRVIRQENCGQSNARNRGTAQAKGRYVTYIDSDDRVEPYYLDYLVRAVRESGAKVACGRIDRVLQEYEPAGRRKRYSVRVLEEREAMREMLVGRHLKVSACCRLIQREVMLSCPLLDGKYYEDLSNTWKVNLEVGRIAFVDAVLYHYCMRGGSITGRLHTGAKQCLDYYEAIEICNRGVLAAYPELERDAAVLKARDYMSLYLSMGRCAEPDEAFPGMETEILRWMRSKGRMAVENRRAPFGVRLRVALFILSPALYGFFYYIGIRFRRKRLA